MSSISEVIVKFLIAMLVSTVAVVHGQTKQDSCHFAETGYFSPDCMVDTCLGYWYYFNCEIKSRHLTIYNRTNTDKIYEGENWTAKVSKEGCFYPSGLYPYTLTIATKDNKTLKYSGKINLVIYHPDKICKESVLLRDIKSRTMDDVKSRTNNKKSEQDNLITEEAATDEEPVLLIAEKEASFPGGNDSLKKFISRNLVYPKEEFEKHINGTVFVTFVVDKQGKIRDIKILRGVKDGEKLNEEAIRLVRTMPPWNPARQNNTPVNMQYNLPIKFELPDSMLFKIDLTKPENVVSAFIWAQEHKNFDVFRYIFDPVDNKGAIAGATKDNQKLLESILFQWPDVKMSGPAVFSERDKCTILISFTKDNKLHYEKLNLINRYGNWYLYKF